MSSSESLNMIRKSLNPVFISSWLFGVPRVSCKYSYRIIYTIVLSTISVTAFLVTYDNRLKAVSSFNSAMVIFFISSQFLSFFGGIGVIIFWFKSGAKALEDAIIEMSEVDVELKALFIEIKYRDLINRQNKSILLFFIILTVIMSLNEYVMDSLGANVNVSIIESISLSHSTYVPHLNILLAELVFSTILQMICQRFYWINETLMENWKQNEEEGSLLVVNKKSTRIRPIREMNNSKDIFFVEIERLYKVHQRLCEITDKVSSSFGWLLYLGVSVSFILTVYRLIVLYSLAFHRLDLIAMKIILNITWVIYYTIKFWMVTMTCCRTSAEANRLGIILHDVEINDEKYYKMLHEYSVQLCQNRIYFTAGGFFSIDLSLVYTLISNVSTFIFIFVDVWAETEEGYRKMGNRNATEL